jgi:predicted outer membrane repeat protein
MEAGQEVDMRYFLAVWGLGAVLATPALSETYLVIPDSHLGNFPNIQAAVDAVVDGDIIELADGVFWGTGNWDIDWGGKEITIRSRSGNQEACIVDGAGLWGEEHRGFYIHDVSQGAVLERVTIRNGEANEGGAICIARASLTITGCTFRDNEGAGNGGAILCGDGAIPMITGCAFLGNSAAQGGGIMCQTGASPTITRCTFVNNNAGPGAGLCI